MFSSAFVFKCLMMLSIASLTEEIVKKKKVLSLLKLRFETSVIFLLTISRMSRCHCCLFFFEWRFSRVFFREDEVFLSAYFRNHDVET